jgi:hypothetical protein
VRRVCSAKDTCGCTCKLLDVPLEALFSHTIKRISILFNYIMQQGNFSCCYRCSGCFAVFYLAERALSLLLDEGASVAELDISGVGILALCVF